MHSGRRTIGETRWRTACRPLSSSRSRGGGETIVKRGVLVCAAIALGMITAPLGAQATPPEPAPSTASYQPQEPPPPFPPMPKKAPSHRWVDVGGHSAAPSHRRSTRSHHTATRKQHHAANAKARDLRFCNHLSARKVKHNSRCQALLREQRRSAEHHAANRAARYLRFCHHLSARKLRHNSRCQVLLRDERRASRTSKDLRFCHHLSARKATRNSRCQVLLRDERRAAEHRKSHGHGKASTHRRSRSAVHHHNGRS